LRIFEKFWKFLEQFRFFGIFEKLFFSILSCYSAYYRYRSMIGKFLSNFFQFHLTRWPKMTFKWPFKDPKVWNLTLKPINYPILLIQLICQLQNIHFSNILTTSLKKVEFPRILDIAQKRAWVISNRARITNPARIDIDLFSSHAEIFNEDSHEYESYRMTHYFLST